MEQTKNQFKIGRSLWTKTDNLNIWKDHYGRIKNMDHQDPLNFQNGDPGYKIADSTQLVTFLPKNVAGVSYNNPHRYYGNNPKTMYIDKRV